MRTASELFAKSLSRECKGDHRCHWCGAPCGRQWTHDDVPNLPFQRTQSSARRPGDPFVCVGCWYYRRKSVTVKFLGGGLKDNQSLRQHSWLLTTETVWGITEADHEQVYSFLLKPRTPFALALLDNPVENMLHLAKLNVQAVVEGDTPLTYTMDNKEYAYTPYELEEALKHGVEYKSGGVALLINRLGPCDQIKAVDPDGMRERGRPRKEDRDRLPGKKIK